MLRIRTAWTMGKKINDDILDELLKGCKRPEVRLGNGGLVRDLKKALMQRMLGVGLAEHLGFEHGVPGRPTGRLSSRAEPVRCGRRRPRRRATATASSTMRTA